MKKALILGINGGFGGHVAEALLKQGWSIRTLMRDPAKLPARFREAEIVKGDASNIGDVRSAAQGVDLLVYGVNPANYNWEGTALPWLEISASIAEELRLTLVFPGNVYVFDPADGTIFDEHAPVKPVTRKGKIREAMEKRLRLASENGAQIIIARAGDFIGQNARSTWMGQLLKRTKSGFVLTAPGNPELTHTWAYLPDFARAVAQLADKKTTLPAFNTFHFKGYQTTFVQIAREIQDATGKPVTLKPFPWWFVSLAAPFSALFGGLREMRYLWKQELNLSDKKMRATLTSIPCTPLGQALQESELLK